MIVEVRQILANCFAEGEIDCIEIRTDASPGFLARIGRAGRWAEVYFNFFEMTQMRDPSWIVLERIDIALRSVGAR